LANTKSTEKRIRTNEKSRKRNSAEKSSLRTAAKNVVKAISDPSNLQNLKDSYKQFTKKMDTAARKGIIHKKTAARKKSRAAKKINTISVKSN
jgi:small subunit ribosomal protein S20